ncbi:MAG: hypothetical protein ACRDWW_01545, partial [Acidimicrobiales bacterium]
MTPRATATVTALPPEREQFDELVSWVRSAHPGPVSILEVGGGGGFYDFPSRLRANASRMVGVDPEPGVLARPWFDAAYRETVEQ